MLIKQIPTFSSRESIRDVLADTQRSQNKPIVDRENYIKDRYGKLTSARRPFEDEAERISQAVMPYLYTPNGSTDIFEQQSTNQSLVAKGVINFCTELSSTIFPSNGRFFKRQMLPNVAEEAAAYQAQAKAMGDDVEAEDAAMIIAQTNNQLIARDTTLREAIKSAPDAENFYQAMVHAAIAGTALFAKPTLETSKVYTLRNFVWKFDSSFETTEVIARDFVHVSKFSPEQLQKLYGHSDLELFEEANISEIEVYTRQIRRYDHWEIQVEINGKRFEDMEGQEDLDKPPFIVLPFFLFEGADYAVGWCSHNKGDIYQYENTSLAINLLIDVASKVFMRIPNGMKTTQKELNEPGFSYLFGDGEIQVVFADVSRLIQSLSGVYADLRKTIMSMFLMNEAAIRDAERLTQEEIKTVMAGLRKILGGLYLSLARRWQTPYLGRVEGLMVRGGRLPALPEDTTQIVMTAGLQTLENAEELQATDQWMQRMAIFPEAATRIDLDGLSLRVANNLSVQTDGVWMNDEKAQEAAGVKEIIGLSKQMGPQGPQMLAALVGKVIQGGPEALAGMMGGLSSMGGGDAGETGAVPPPEVTNEGAINQ